MIEALSADRADEPLRERVLPRAGGRGQDFTDSQTVDAVPERGAVDRVAIAEEVRRRGVVREGVHDLLGGPLGGGMLGHVEVDDTATLVSEHDEDEEDAQARGGDREEIEATRSRTWLVRNVRQVWDRGVCRFGSSRETVRSATSMPSFTNSPWILGAPHRGFAAAIRETRARISALTGGRPPVGRPESLVQ
jgi:hypothetical protein